MLSHTVCICGVEKMTDWMAEEVFSALLCGALMFSCLMLRKSFGFPHFVLNKSSPTLSCWVKTYILITFVFCLIEVGYRLPVSTC